MRMAVLRSARTCEVSATSWKAVERPTPTPTPEHPPPLLVAATSSHWLLPKTTGRLLLLACIFLLTYVSGIMPYIFTFCLFCFYFLATPCSMRHLSSPPQGSRLYPAPHTCTVPLCPWCPMPLNPGPVPLHPTSSCALHSHTPCTPCPCALVPPQPLAPPAPATPGCPPNPLVLSPCPCTPQPCPLHS